MKITAAMLSELVALGLTPEQMAGVAAVVEKHREEPVVSAGAERQRRYRERHRNVTGDAEVTPVPPLKERSPTPPKENNPPLVRSEANASSRTAREGTTSEPMARAEFESEFWQHYPNKVGKPKALDAYIAARRKATLPEILDGLARYKSDKPPDRQWLNPATFLNQERWNDEPATVTARQPNAKPEPPHDPLFRALANVAYGRDGGGEWAADDDVRLLDHDRGAAPA